jgi:uncharacterized protein YvpB
VKATLSSSAPSPGRPASNIVRRRRAAASGIVLAIATGAVLVLSNLGGTGRSSGPPHSNQTSEAILRLVLGGKTLAERPTNHLSGLRSQASLLGLVPASTILRQKRATITLRTDRETLAISIRHAVTTGGGTVFVPQEPVASNIRLPVIKQTLQDDCEATALSMMLSFGGERVGQLTLQDQVARSGPLDPEQGPEGEIWGDPSLGFVGRADGGGPAGGFGVYQGPIMALARRHGVLLHGLSQKSPQGIYRTLLSGHPVMVWVALAEGPYASWHSPSGKLVHINYGEHAVVLSGVSKGDVTVNDPLSGERLTWTKSQFEAMWASLGRRALAD